MGQVNAAGIEMACRIFNGRLHSPYFIFIEAAGALSDREILAKLGLSDWVGCPPGINYWRQRLYLTEDDAWIHIADDWRYSLWHTGKEHMVDVLHASMPYASIFAFWSGNAESSFGFTYYNSGRLVRKYTVEDPRYDITRRIVTEDFGSPLPAEPPSLESASETLLMFPLASSLGIKLDHRVESIRCYESTHSPRTF